MDRHVTQKMASRAKKWSEPAVPARKAVCVYCGRGLFPWRRSRQIRARLGFLLPLLKKDTGKKGTPFTQAYRFNLNAQK